MAETKANNEDLGKLQQKLKEYILLCRAHKSLLSDKSTKEEYDTFVDYFKMVSNVLKKGGESSDSTDEGNPVLEKNMQMLDKKLDQLLAVFDQF